MAENLAMTVADLHDRMSNAEYEQWRAYYKWKGWTIEQEQMKQRAKRR